MSAYKIALALALIAFALIASRASAAEFYSSHCTRSGCTFMSGETLSAEPHIIKIKPSAEKEARIAGWEAYCRPQTITGAFGVERYVYAHEGCEFGRSHD